MDLSLGRRAFVALCASLLACAAAAQEKFIVMASTTSTEQSGLFAHLLPLFKQARGIDQGVYPSNKIITIGISTTF